MKHLYLKLYLALIGVLAMTGVAFGLIAHLVPAGHHGAGRLPNIAAVAVWRSLPPPEDPSFQRAVADRARELDLDLAIYHQTRGRLAAGSASELPAVATLREGWLPTRGGPLYVVPIEGPYWLAARDRTHHAPKVAKGLAAMLGFASLLALACYPVARAMTRRLEALEKGVEAWGTGALDRRVPVTGRDEISALAASFNQAAERIEALVTAQRSVLANASHELRSPLARLRVALELMMEAPTPEARRRLASEASQNIEELDALVDEVLDAARSEARVEHGLRRSELDLAELVRAEAAAHAAEVSAPERLHVSGDRRLIERLLRNLLQNAARHAPMAPVEVELSSHDEGIELVVRDRGPGVPEADRERIFLPFYRAAGHNEGEHGGVGLGLSLVKQVAEAHGGSVAYAPRDGGGACFRVRLPAALVSQAGARARPS